LRVFENRVLRRTFGLQRDEVMGQWRTLHSGELHNFYSSLDIIRQIKSRGMSWVGHVACMREGGSCTGFWWESPRERGHLKDHGIDGRIGSRWTLGRLAGRGVEWIHLAEDRDCWWAFVNAVMNLWVLEPQS
jgi:hypothetical protein